MTAHDTTVPPRVRTGPLRGPGRWVRNWTPEDEEVWASGGRRMAVRNLVASVLAEHIGFSVWAMWSVLVLFMSPAIGFSFDAGDKFLLVLMPTLVGAVLRLPYSAAVIRFGGRNWTIFSTAVLLVPALLGLYFVQRPGTPLWVFLLIGATAGLGGGNFASSMTNIALFFPRRLQGWALGVNGGGGNLGVASTQLLGLLVITTAGDLHPSYVVAAYLPLIVLATLLAALRLDNVDVGRPVPGRWRRTLTNAHTWWISLLYVGTFGSFIGYGFAFGLVLQIQFGATPLQAVTYTFIGPLLGSLARPVGGWLADRWGGARITLVSLLGMAAGTVVLIAASSGGEFGLFVAGFTAIFVLAGVGNGSTYKMIPATAERWARDSLAGRHDPVAVNALAQAVSGLTIGIAGALGTLGGVAINLAFLAAYRATGSGEPAFLGFLAFYAVCLVVVRAVYLKNEVGR